MANLFRSSLAMVGNKKIQVLLAYEAEVNFILHILRKEYVCHKILNAKNESVLLNIYTCLHTLIYTNLYIYACYRHWNQWELSAHIEGHI